jgi:hypothetical protein
VQIASKRKSPIIIYIATITGGVVLLIVLVATAFVLHRRKRRNKYKLLRTFDEEDYVRLISDVTLIEKIGSGQFGDVFKAWMDVCLYHFEFY